MPSPKFFYLLFFCLIFGISSVQAQIHGIAPSVTSYGFGGNFNPAPGPRASVTSLGPFGYTFWPPANGRCCITSFGQPFSPFPEDRFSNFGIHHHRGHFGPEFTPAYGIPYGYAYPVAVPVSEGYADDPTDDKYSEDDPPAMERRHLPKKQDQDEVAATREADLEPAESAVSAQPTTTLVFKDGHKLDVENYAIVGEILFEFSSSLTYKIQLADLDLPATQKLNDDRGVEFHAPANGAQ